MKSKKKKKKKKKRVKRDRLVKYDSGVKWAGPFDTPTFIKSKVVG